MSNVANAETVRDWYQTVLRHFWNLGQSRRGTLRYHSYGTEVSWYRSNNNTITTLRLPLLLTLLMLLFQLLMS